MSPAPLRNKQPLAAFTVVEMLAAIALLSMISIMLFTALNNITTITTSTMSKASIYQDARTVIDQMGRELQQMMPYTIITATGPIDNITAEAVGLNKYLDWVAVIDNNEGHEEAEVHYYYDGTNTLYKSLVFYSNVVPDWDWNTNKFWRNTPVADTSHTLFATNFSPVLEGVRSVDFQLWVSNANPNLATDVPVWAGKTNNIPGYVRVTIKAFDPAVMRRWKTASAVPNSLTNQLRSYSIFVHIPRSSE